MLYNGVAMKGFLDNFSLSHILRQFFCGVVFFVPFFCLPADLNKVHTLKEWIQISNSNKDWSNPKLALLCILACIIGTVIYHLEKNLWSYPLQCVFERGFNESILVSDRDKEVKHNGAAPAAFLLGGFFSFFILFAIVLSCFNNKSDWACKFYPVIACGLFLAYLLFIWAYLLGEVMKFNAGGFQNIMRRTRAMWVMEELKVAEIQQFASVREEKESIVHHSSYRDALACAAIVKRLASWSDYIHSVQCMCFAWLLGVGCVVASLAQENANIPHASFLWISVFFSIGVILLEAMFEYHRYYHLVYITAHFYRIHSLLDSHHQPKS